MAPELTTELLDALGLLTEQAADTEKNRLTAPTTDREADCSPQECTQRTSSNYPSQGETVLSRCVYPGDDQRGTSGNRKPHRLQPCRQEHGDEADFVD